jgi:hemerythrin superfamily protein
VIAVAETSVKSTDDVVAFLKEQHNRIKELFTDTINAPDDKTRERAFFELRSLLAVHETAEEIVVHPKARSEIEGGDEIVRARLEEENQAKKQLSEIERMGTGSQEFVDALIRFQRDVIDHATHEENEEFNKLHGALSEEELKQMVVALRAAEAIAPTRPHPGVESAKENLAVGPFASMLDRARDALQTALR